MIVAPRPDGPGPRRRSIARAVGLSGVALHGGQSVSVELRPAPPGAGRFFSQAGRAPIPALLDHVVSAHFATTLAADGWSVRTVEHLLSAAAGLDVDDLEVAVVGDELPALDGSAGPWVAALDRAGIVETAGSPDWIRVTAPVRVTDGGRSARLAPGSGCALDLSIAFAHPGIGDQRLRGDVDRNFYRAHLAEARTFGFFAEVEAMRAAGLARGGSLDNAVVFDDSGVKNPGGLRWSDEPVRHKALDLIGDLALLGARFEGEVSTTRPGHRLTHELLRRARASECLRAGPGSGVSPPPSH